jgi:DNA-binding NarL/FixJ family response regulator
MEKRDPKHTLLICDDHSVFRLGLKTLLEPEGFHVLEAGDHYSALEMAYNQRPGCIIMDYLIPGKDGLTTLEKIRSSYGCRSVLLTNVIEQGIIEKCEEAGIEGYISKQEDLETIRGVILRVIKGERVYVKPTVIEGKGPPSRTNPFEELTVRERELVRELARGGSQREIADRMGISLRTLEKHRSNINEKIGKMSAGELVRSAFIWGLIEEDPFIPG